MQPWNDSVPPAAVCNDSETIIEAGTGTFLKSKLESDPTRKVGPYTKQRLIEDEVVMKGRVSLCASKMSI
ncbi:unnamed protein product [Protopolystoma xenopodis]|uniref:Uncharacterized protein n=1 Tax=Protopolystoma xenopodis TaxID=117903 RepID=A0A448WT74_9PLAT|nr:unnamed protein product [Protopolystoma xenopodis]